jgi:two-component system chemotaxis response regulator CheB
MSAGRDILVIGASAGGVRALEALIAGLPADLGAAVFVVLHSSARHESQIVSILARRSQLTPTLAVHGETIQPGRVYVAPPDNHLLVRAGYVHVVRGPKENGHRPAVDPLFRSAAAVYGPRVVGVVLTGHLDCGTAGMMSIKARGGVGVAQDPREAEAPEMPRHAIEHAGIDHVVTLADMPALLTRLVAEPAGARPAHVLGALLQLEGVEEGVAAELVCPTCQGKLTEAEVNGFSVFRCHVGHAFSLESVIAEQGEEVERALWAAVRALDEAAALSRRLVERSTGHLRDRFEERGIEQHRQAELIRRLLLAGGQASALDAVAVDRARHDPD